MTQDHRQQGDLPIQIAPDTATLAQTAAREFVQCCGQALREREWFAVCLSGGNTPAWLFDVLARPPFAQAVPWHRVLVFWGDERHVLHDDPRSNYHMAVHHLLRHVAIPPAHVFPVPTRLDQPCQAAARYEETLRQIFKGKLGLSAPVFDLVYLGLGDDGHTASLFPGDALLQQPWPDNPKDAAWVAAPAQAYSGVRRVTLMPWALAQARTVVFLVSGANKARPLQRMLQGPHRPAALPAQAVWLRCRERCRFLVDAAAARLLQTPAMASLDAAAPF